MKKVKIKWKNVIMVIILFILIGFFISSVYNIIMWVSDNKNISKQVDNISKDVNITEVSDTDETVIVDQNEEIEKSNPYWDYIKMNLINVDFSSLKNTNSNVRGWIQVNGTNINYPFVQTDNNEYYLTHAFDNTYNKAGWIFMDYRNNSHDFDSNTILYGHGRLDTTMFGSLKNILKSNWYNNLNNHIIKLSTENENTLWQVFSVYRIKTTSDYIQTEFNNDSEYGDFLNMISERSTFNFNTKVNNSDKILTLSTCYNNNDKVVMHAKLIKRQKR